MKKWKKVALSGVCAAMSVAACLAFASCRKGGLKNQFVVDEGNIQTQSGKQGEDIVFPEVSKEGYIFKGWYISDDYTGMPVTSGTYDGETVYYAKWVKGYEVKFDLGGGAIGGYDASKKIYLEEGANISEFVKDYVPTNGDYQFGGWYVGDEVLGTNDKMTTSGIELLARYKAEYTVNVYLQDIQNQDVYTVNDDLKVTGYALIDEEFRPEVTVDGFTQTANEHECVEKEISGTVSENVFSLYFDRNKVTLTLSSNDPNGNSELQNVDYLYGQTVTLPENNFSAEGCRFLGWALDPNATYADILPEGALEIDRDKVLYAVWNVAYTDVFNGQDLIYLDPEDNSKLTLCRGGIDIPSTRYDDRNELYIIAGDDIDISVQLNSDGTFVYYSNRQGSYKLVANNVLNEKVTIVLDETNGITYSSREEGGEFFKKGTYSIDTEGLYTAVFPVEGGEGESETLEFKIGVGRTETGYVNIFKIRGEEFTYGQMARYRDGNTYYPLLTLDGFGSGTCALPPQEQGGEDQTAALTYTIEDGIINVTVSAARLTFIARIFEVEEIKDRKFYGFYTAALDKTFQDADGQATLTLDGIDKATYTNGNESYTGVYTSAEAQVGGYIVTVTVTAGDTKTEYTYLVGGENFIAKENGYYDYRYINEASGAVTVPIIVIEGEKGTLYELKDDALTAVSTGTITKDGNATVYTVVGDVAEWSETKYKQIKFMTAELQLTNGASANCYYILSYTTTDETLEEVATVYTGANGETLTLTQLFAIYETAGSTTEEKETYEGIYSSENNFISLRLNDTTMYFELDAQAKTFVKLSQIPLTIKHFLPGVGVLPGVTLTLTGRYSGEGENEKEVVIYKTSSVTYTGTTETKEVSVGGLSGTYYTFTGTKTEGQGADSFSFDFVFQYDRTNGYVYLSYENKETFILEFMQTLGKDGKVPEDKTSTITLRNDGKIEYDPDTSVKDDELVGTCTKEEGYPVFGEVPYDVYTFVPDDANATGFKYTLRGSSTKYFMVSEGDGTVEYTAADGSTFVLDLTTHFAKYTDADGVYTINYYYEDENVIDANKVAYRMYNDTESVTRYFDVTGEGTFSLRGLEAGSYLMVYNGTLAEKSLKLDGYHKATLSFLEDETAEPLVGEYEYENDTYTLRFSDNSVYKGVLGVFSISGAYLNGFFIADKNFEGTFLNKSDLSVLVLNGTGNATRYSSYGIKETGTYTMLDDGLFFFINSSGTSGGVFTIGAENTVVATDYSETYYADDLSSLIFTETGLVRLNNGSPECYAYNEKSNLITVYRKPAEDENTETVANQYGFIAETYQIDGENKITYLGKAYKLFDNDSHTLTDANGNTLRFKPTGEAEFSVDGQYTENGATTETDCTVTVFYNTDGTVTAVVSFPTEDKINGSVTSYRFSNEYKLATQFNAGTYTQEANPTTGIIAWDYAYAIGRGPTAYLKLIKENDSFKISGGFSGIGGVDGKALTFEDGVLSKAGYLHKEYGNRFLCEFTGSDKELYHLSFYLYEEDGVQTFITYALTLVTSQVTIGENTDTVFYTEALVYTLFDISFEAGDAYYPSLRYKNELICAVGWGNDREKSEWTFMAHEYSGTREYATYYYDFVYSVTDNTATGVSARKYTQEHYNQIVTGEGSAVTFRAEVYASRDFETKEFFEITELTVNGQALKITDCVKNDDGTFTVTTETGFYKVTFTVTGSGDTEDIKVAVEETTAPAPAPDPDPGTESGTETGTETGADGQ